MTGMPFYGFFFPSLRIHLLTDQINPGSSSSTPTRSSLVCGVIFIFIWFIFVLYLSLLCHPTHPYLLSPHFNFWEPTRFSAIVSHLIHSIFISPLCLLLGYGLCAGPALNMYLYVGLVCCWHSPDLISTWIPLPPVSSTATLGLFLLITQSLTLDLSTSCVFEALWRKPTQHGFAL